MKLPKGWKCSLKRSDANMLMLRFQMTRRAYFKLLLKAAWSFDISPMWIKPFAVLYVSAKLFLRGE